MNTEPNSYISNESLDEFEKMKDQLVQTLTEGDSPVAIVSSIMIVPLLDVAMEEVSKTIKEFINVHGQNPHPAQVLVGCSDMSAAVYDALTDSAQHSIFTNLTGLETAIHYCVAAEFVKQLRVSSPLS